MEDRYNVAYSVTQSSLRGGSSKVELRNCFHMQSSPLFVAKPWTPLKLNVSYHLQNSSLTFAIRGNVIKFTLWGLNDDNKVPGEIAFSSGLTKLIINIKHCKRSRHKVTGRHKLKILQENFCFDSTSYRLALFKLVRYSVVRNQIWSDLHI